MDFSPKVPSATIVLIGSDLAVQCQWRCPKILPGFQLPFQRNMCLPPDLSWAGQFCVDFLGQWAHLEQLCKVFATNHRLLLKVPFTFCSEDMMNNFSLLFLCCFWRSLVTERKLFCGWGSDLKKAESFCASNRSGDIQVPKNGAPTVQSDLMDYLAWHFRRSFIACLPEWSGSLKYIENAKNDPGTHC